MRKKSIKRAAEAFCQETDAIQAFLTTVAIGRSKEHESWLYEYAIIRLYRGFEALIREALVGAINNSTATLSSRTGIQFPPHLSNEVCEFLVVGNGFFDFKGRDGLIGTLKQFVPDTHYLVGVAKSAKYRTSLERLAAFRNLAAHESTVSRTRAKAAITQERMGSAGSWLKRQGRFTSIADSLKDLALELKDKAPY